MKLYNDTETINTIDNIISTIAITVLFFIVLSLYYVINDGKYIMLDNVIISTYIIPTVITIVWVTVKKLRINILQDLCKIF